MKITTRFYLLHQVLPQLANLSKVFQVSSVSFAAIGPTINYTLKVLRTVSEQKPLSAFQKHLCTDGRLSVYVLSSPSAHQEQNLNEMITKILPIS